MEDLLYALYVRAVLADRFHVDVRTVIFGTSIGIGNANADKDLCFVDVKTIAVVFKNLNNKIPPGILRYKSNSDWTSGKSESTLKEINLWATLCVIHRWLNG